MARRRRTSTSLSMLDSGAAVKALDEGFQRLLENIADPQTEPETLRQLQLTVQLRPTPDRAKAQVTIRRKLKLDDGRAVNTFVALEQDRQGKLFAFEEEAPEDDSAH